MGDKSKPDVHAELEKLRLSTGLSQEDYAREIGVKYSNYRRYESGETAKVPADALILAQRETPRLVAERKRRERAG